MAKCLGINAHLCDMQTGEPLQHYEIISNTNNRATRYVSATPGQEFYVCIYVPSDFLWENCNALQVAVYINSKDALFQLPIIRPVEPKALVLNIKKWPVWAIMPGIEEWKDASFRFREAKSGEYILGQNIRPSCYEAPGCLRISFKRLRVFEYARAHVHLLTDQKKSTFRQLSECKDKGDLEDLKVAVEPKFEPLSLTGRKISRMEIATEGSGLNKTLRFHFRDPETIASKLIQPKDDITELLDTKPSSVSRAPKIQEVTNVRLRLLEERTPPAKAMVEKRKRAGPGPVTATHIVERKRLHNAECNLPAWEPRTCCFQHVWKNGEDFYDYYARASIGNPLQFFDDAGLAALSYRGAALPSLAPNQSMADPVPGEPPAVARKRRKVQEIYHRIEMKRLQWEKARAERELAEAIDLEREQLAVIKSEPGMTD